jgi:hypothetical protein
MLSYHVYPRMLVCKEAKIRSVREENGEGERLRLIGGVCIEGVCSCIHV